ncbi:muscular LMNA-interacting protein [Trichomycterus rosablanca]|uniref:muscular LMNA-interacting protein n=1 Tax=Trichomycterus rosablanca TaxID=2290929 RepID=UPI002F34FACC
MALEQPRGALGKVTVVVATKLKSFSILPVLKKIPTESRALSAWEKKSSRLNQALGDPEASEGKMTKEGVYKAEIVHVKESADMVPQERSKHSETKEKSTDKPALTPSSSPVVLPAELGCASQKLSLVTMDTAYNKHSGISQLDRHIFQGAEVSSEMFLNSKSHNEEEVLSPASSVDVLTTASSRESALSEGWDKERSWSALPMFSPCTSPVTFSHTVSPCSSVRSGAFTPSVMRIKSHSLAPGSSLVQMPPTSCQTLGCSSRAASPCPLSGRGRHRLPPTHLSLLTAILRKGRLPILSPALQRPYSPCWPVSPINMSSCSGCSAASALAPMVRLQGDSSIYPSHNTKPLKLLSEKLKMSPEKKKGISATPPVESSDAFDSFSFAVRSRTISSPDDGICLNMPSASTSEPPLAHFSTQTYKDSYVPKVPSFSLFKSSSIPTSFPPKSTHSLLCTSESKTPPGNLSEHSAKPYSEYSKELYCTLDSSGQEYRQKSGNAFSILEAEEPCRTPSPLKLVQKPYYLSSTADPKSAHQPQASAIIQHADEKPSSNLQYALKITSEQERVLSTSPGFRHSPFPRVAGPIHLAYTPPISPTWTSPRPGSCSSTTDRYTLPASSATPDRFLSPSPTYSFCSSPASSPRDDTPDSTDKSRKPHKIKSSYKAFAAIPTNKLLLEQQVIDDTVEKNEALLDPSDNFAWEDPHLQMSSPAELRQQSAELYEVIDEVLQDVKQTFKTSHAKKPTVKSSASETLKKTIPVLSPSTLGRETKYAHPQTPTPTERTQTRPGVIRRVEVKLSPDDGKARQLFTVQSERHQDHF